MIIDYRYYREILARLKKPIFSIAHNTGFAANSTPSLEAYISYGLGSGIHGKVISELPCSNASNRGSGGDICSNMGLLACTQVRVMYHSTSRVLVVPYSHVFLVLSCQGAATNILRSSLRSDE